MDAKLTPEQAIKLLKNLLSTGNKPSLREMHEIAALIESLAADAALGRAAVKAKHDKVLCDTCWHMEYMREKGLCNRCECQEFCRKLDEYDRLRTGKDWE